MFDINNLLDKKLKIKNCLENNLIDEAQSLIIEYEKLNPYDLELCTIKSTFYFMKEDFISAEKELLKGYEKFEFNFDINYNLAVVCMYNQNYKKSAYYFLRCILIDPVNSNNIIEQIQYLLEKYLISLDEFNDVKKDIKNIEYNINKQFPLKDKSNFCLGDFLYETNNVGYVAGYYDYYFPERDGMLLEINDNQKPLIDLFKVEILPCKKVKNFKFNTTTKNLIPIMKLNTCDKVSLNINSKNYEIKNMLPNRFYYYPIEKDANVSIDCDNDFFLGNIIPLTYNKNKPKVILNIFIDGLSQKFLEDKGLEKAMPNTYKFFKKGTICNNCYVSGEWTYVSLASFFTGEYTSNHMVYHPDYSTNRLFNKKLFHQVFKDNGYLTAKIDGDWRSTPTSGYIKGFDRYLYQPSIRGMHCDDIIIETIEHIEAFKQTNNFIWICIPDLHDIADEYETRLSTQSNDSIEYRIFERNIETSVRKPYDSNKIHRYGTQLKRIDTYLGLLLNYLESNFSDDELLISLMADHGQGYMVNSGNFLDEERLKVPMMFRGHNIPQGICNELIQGLDLFPILLHSSDIKYNNIKGGNIPKYFKGNIERNFTYSESIFPKSPYRATINDKTHKFFFETKENCNIDGRFKINDYRIKLINKTTNENETNTLPDKVNKYLDVIFDHIKEHIIIE